VNTNGYLTCEDLRRVTNDLCCNPCHKSLNRNNSQVEIVPMPPEDDPDCPIKAVICCGMDKRNRTKDNFELAFMAKQEASSGGKG
jgi:hypothetical protein